MTPADLLLMLPELFLTLWLCVILAIDFSLPRFSKRDLAYLSVLGLVAVLGNLFWFDRAGITGTLFNHMFVVDRMAIFFKIFIVLATILVILASIDYVKRFKYFKGEYYFLVLMSALGMMFMASANDLLSIFITLEFSTFGFYVLVNKLVFGARVEGWTSVMLAVLFFGGVQLVMIGVLGEYIGKILAELKARPVYFVAEHQVKSAQGLADAPPPRAAAE